MFNPSPKIKFKLYHWLTNLPFRHSLLFDGWREIICGYTRAEEILQKAFKLAAVFKMEGDYLEFGCYQGHSLATAFHFARKKRLDAMRFFAFDSFAGLPEVSPADQLDSPFQKGSYACDLADFQRRLRRKKVDLNRIITVPGFYQDTLNSETKKKLNIGKAAIVYVDCDLYESAVPVLNFIADYLQDGTILIFDDWFLFRGRPDRGEQRAFNEWLKNNPRVAAAEFFKYGWHGNSFIINIGDD